MVLKIFRKLFDTTFPFESFNSLYFWEQFRFYTFFIYYYSISNIRNIASSVNSDLPEKIEMS